MTATIKLPPFELLKKQPKIPHVAHDVARNDVANEHGALITFIVSESRNGKSWWIRAAREGLRMSNTLHTSVQTKADAWIAAVKAGTVSVAREVVLKCEMATTCAQPVTHIDNKGFVYCTCHGEQRRAHRPCRKLRAHEITKLTIGQTIRY